MPRRHHVNKDAHGHHHQPRLEPAPIPQFNYQLYVKIASKYLHKAYKNLNERYFVVFTLLFVVILSFLLPDISSKMKKTNELKAMKSTLDQMSKEVRKAEVACLAVADNFCCLHCSMRDKKLDTAGDFNVHEPVQIEKKIGLFRRFFFPKQSTSLKEIAITSFLYSDSFTGKNNTY